MTIGIESTHLPFTEVEIEGSLIARWQRVLAHCAERIAVTTVDGARYTYAALDHTSNQLAQALLERLGPENCPVVLLLDHSYPLLTSILGTLKAGKAYVAFDTTQAVGQLQLLHQASAAPLIVTNQEYLPLAQALVAATTATQQSRQPILTLESLPATTLGIPPLAIAPDAIAGIFFTSGTIAQPKGVARSHRLILRRAWLSDTGYTFTTNDAISGIRQCGLGSGMADVFNALLYGATYCLYDLQRHGLQGLSAWLQREQITYFHPPIVLFRQWLDTLAPDEFYPHLRYVLPSGRKTRADLERLWPHVADDCAVITSYSCTETMQITASALTRSTPLAEGVLHVGAPLPGKQVTVLNDGQPVAVGEVGEIFVRSRYMSSDYWRQPELTAQRFTRAEDGSGDITFRTGDFGRLHADGYLELVGRQDSQVKLRGYRVVLGEIEDALRALPAVREAAVTADEGRGQLYAYLIAAAEPPAPAAAIRSALAAHFPAYALPTHIIYLPSFPLLPSGKINRKVLPPPTPDQSTSTDSYQAPRNELEQQLVTLCETVLQIRPIGIQDNFFERGGHSLLAMRLMVEIERQQGTALALADFFRQPTVAHLAHLLTKPGEAAAAVAPETDLFARLATTLSPQQVATVRAIYQQLGQPDQPQQWRKSVIERWHRRRKAIHAAGRLLPPARRGAWLAGLLTNPTVRRACFGREESLIRRFLATIETPHQDERAVVAALVMGALHHYQLALPYDATARQRAKQTIAAAQATGQGLILVRSHESTVNGFAALGLNSYRVGQIQNHLPDFQFDDPVVESALYTQQLDTARRLLQQGRLIDLSADGIQGYSTALTLPFHNRVRPFWPSFAELALMTDAQVRLITTALPTTQPQGPVAVQVSEPLPLASTALPYAERVEALVQHYVMRLAQIWGEMPWLVPWYQMARHLAYPPVRSQ